jgi:hypothetical protein
MAKPNLLRIIGIAAFLPLVLLGVQVHADTTCYAPAPVDCATLSTTECSQQNSEYQSEAAIYNSCIAANYSVDAQSSANQIRIQSYCDSSGDVQSCTAEYDACQATAPTNSFGQPAGSGTCTYSCDSGYYMSISNTCRHPNTRISSSSNSTYPYRHNRYDGNSLSTSFRSSDSSSDSCY